MISRENKVYVVHSNSTLCFMLSGLGFLSPNTPLFIQYKRERNINLLEGHDECLIEIQSHAHPELNVITFNKQTNMTDTDGVTEMN